MYHAEIYTRAYVIAEAGLPVAARKDVAALDQIAHRTGLDSAELLRVQFRDQLSTTPTAYRRAFTPSDNPEKHRACSRCADRLTVASFGLIDDVGNDRGPGPSTPTCRAVRHHRRPGSERSPTRAGTMDR